MRYSRNLITANRSTIRSARTSIAYCLHAVVVLALVWPFQPALAFAASSPAAGPSNPIAATATATATSSPTHTVTSSPSLTTTTTATRTPLATVTVTPQSSTTPDRSAISGTSHIFLPIIASSSQANIQPNPGGLTQTLQSMPVLFVQNAGQFADGARFQVQGAHAGVYLADHAIWFTLLERPQVDRAQQQPFDRLGALHDNMPRTGVNLKLSFPGSNPNPLVEPFNRVATHVSYFVGNDPSKWHPDVPVWGGVRYVDLYPGIDLEITSANGQMVQRLVAHPGADLNQVRMRVEGATAMSLDRARLRVTTTVGDVELPLLQVTGAARPAAGPTINGDQVAAPFAPSQPGVQSPSSLSNPDGLLYSTFLGGTSWDFGRGIAVDASGAAYVTGNTLSTDFPTTPGAFQPGPVVQAYTSGFVTKLGAAGIPVYSTYLRGSGVTFGDAIAVNGDGNAYVTGQASTGFPTTIGAFQPTSYAGGDVFVTELNANGTALVYSTYLGPGVSNNGAGEGWGIALDSIGNAYVTGRTYSTIFPTQNPLQSNNAGGYDAFVTKLNASGSALIYSTYLGGSGDDVGFAIAVDGSGNAYVAGSTASTNFPTFNAFQGVNAGHTDVFVAKLNASGSALVYSTYLGGSGDECPNLKCGIAVDASGAAYLAGGTSSANFPTTAGAYQTALRGTWDAFVTKLTPDGRSLAYSTFLGGSASECINGGCGIAVDANGSAYIAGFTQSSDFPTTVGAVQTNLAASSQDAFVTKLTPDGSGLVYSTFLGGTGTECHDIGYGGPINGGCSIAVDASGNAYVTGETDSADFPVTFPQQIDLNCIGGCQPDAFVAKLAVGGSFNLPPSQSLAVNECPICDNQSRVYQAGLGINVNSGNFNYQHRDGQIAGALGMPLSFESSYNSLATGANVSYTTIYTSVLGYGWTHNFNVNLVLSPTGELTNVVMLIAPRGSQLRFTGDGNGNYTPFPGVLAQLVRTGSPGAYAYVATTNSQYVYTFNNGGHLVSVTDPQGHVTNLTYSGGKLSQIADPSGTYALALSYNGSGLLQSVTDTVNNRTATYSYTNGDLTGVTDMNHMAWTYVYSASTHLLWKVIDPTNRTVVESRYDGSGRDTQQYDGLSQLIAQVNYSPTVANNRQVLTTNPVTGNLVTTTVFYGQGLPVAVQDPYGNQTQTAFNGGLNPAVSSDARNNSTVNAYSGTLLTGVRDALKNSWGFAYTNLNYPSVITDARQFTQTNTYSGTLLIARKDALGNTTLYTYTTGTDAPEPAGLVRYQQDPRIGIIRYQYNPQGQVLTTTADFVSPGTFDPAHPDRNLITSYTYDSQGRQLTITGPAGQVTKSDYNPTSGLVITTTENYWAGQPANYRNQYNLLTTYGYDVAGRPLTTTVNVGTALAQVQLSSYDLAGRLTSMTKNLLAGQGQNYRQQYNLVTQYGYDVVSNQILVTDTLSHVTRAWFDALRRPVTVTSNYTGSGAFVPFNPANPDQNITTLMAYDPNGNVISTTQYVGASIARTTLTAYDPDNRPISTTTNFTGSGAFSSAAPDQNITTLTLYDPNGNVISTTQYVGASIARTTLTAYDPDNRPISMTTNFAGSGAFTSATPDQNLTNLTRYDPNGNVISTTQYYGATNLAGVSLARTMLTAYDADNRPISTTTNYDPSPPANSNDRNLTTLTLFDQAGNVISTTEYAGTSLARTTVTQYDSAKRPVTVTLNYIGSGAFSASAPDQNLTRITVYGPASERQATAELRGGPGLGAPGWITTTYGYDNLGRLITTTLPLTAAAVAVTTLSYDPLSRVTDTTDPLTHVIHTDYDGLSRVLTSTVNYVNGGAVNSQTNLPTVTTYDAAGNRIKVADPKSNATQFQYDLLNRLVTVTDALTGTTRYGYDAAGNLLTVVDANTHTLTNTYDLLNRMISATDPLSHQSQYTYDAAGGHVATLDANGKTITSTYDLLNRLSGIIYPAPDTAVSFAYDVIGRRTMMTDSLGTTTWTYDGADRPITITQPFTGSLGYTYDSAGNKLALNYPDGKTVRYTYDLASRLVQVQDWQGKLTGYSYNAMGQTLTVTFPNGITSTIGYDGAERLANIAHQTVTQTLASYVYTLDQTGNRTQVVETTGGQGSANGSVGDQNIESNSDSQSAGAAEAFQYTATATGSVNGLFIYLDSTSTATQVAVGLYTDTSNNPGSLLTQGTITIPVAATWNSVAVTATTVTSGTKYWIAALQPFGVSGTIHFRDGCCAISQANKKSRLSSLPSTWSSGTNSTSSPMSAYAALGTTINYAYDNLYRLNNATYSTGAVFTYTYDAVGNRLTQTTITNSLAYTYDIANRLVNVAGQAYTWDNNGNLLSDGALNYVYDSANRPVTITQGANTYLFGYNGMGNRRRQVVNGVPTTYTLDLNAGLVQVLADSGGNTYLYGVGRIAQQNASSTGYFLPDALGSVRQLADANANVTLAKRYDPYGNVLTSAGSTSSTYGFAGEVTDGTGLDYMRARYYSSQQGRFVQKDNWGSDYSQPRSLNRWLYAAGDPINYTDPTGMWRWNGVTGTNSFFHAWAEDWYEQLPGNPDKQLEYQLPLSGLKIDMFNSGLGSVYEVEPIYLAGQGLIEMATKTMLLNWQRASLVGQYRRAGLPPTGLPYDWRNSPPLYFYPGLGADWPGVLRLSLTQIGPYPCYDYVADYTGLPGIVFYWLELNQGCAQQQQPQRVPNKRLVRQPNPKLPPLLPAPPPIVLTWICDDILVAHSGILDWMTVSNNIPNIFSQRIDDVAPYVGFGNNSSTKTDGIFYLNYGLHSSIFTPVIDEGIPIDGPG